MVSASRLEFEKAECTVSQHRNLFRKSANLPLLVGFAVLLNGQVKFEGIVSADDRNSILPNNITVRKCRIAVKAQKRVWF